jgi:hypothetical protein
MEFEQMLNFFTSLNYARRKYPMSVTYTKYLQRLHADKNYRKQNEEIVLFKKFLVSNPEIGTTNVDGVTKTLTCDEFKTGKNGTILNMREFFIDGHVDIFWENIQRINDFLFPKGKQDTESFEAETTNDNILKQFQNNRILADTFEQIQKVDIKNIKNVRQLLESETFQEIVNKLSTSFSDGTYNMDDVSSLTTTVTSVVDNLSNSDSVNEKTRDNLKVVSDAIGCMKDKRDFDVNRLLGIIGSIDLSN